MVNKALILRKLSELEEYYDQIAEYSEIELVKYIKDWKTQRIVERTLQIMIELCVDIASHIISDEGYRTPKSYADTFRVLYERKRIEQALFEKMEKMAKFRNVVVHHYDKVDASIVVSILNKYLQDFLAYKEAIVGIIKDVV
jgi:uncharacterized protein YutE (UPF0331/DUF86 family)